MECEICGTDLPILETEMTVSRPICRECNESNTIPDEELFDVNEVYWQP